MRIRQVGTNHRHAPVEVRERLALPEDQVPSVLDQLCALPGVREAVLVSTCNRVELTWVDDGACVEDVVELLGARSGVGAERLEPHLFHHVDEEAVHHLFRVCCGLESMVLGETQIAGQVKEGYRIATEAGTAGPLLHKLFHKAFAVAKRVRTETEIGASTVSVANAAVDMAGRVFDDLARHPVLLLGAGEMGELALKGFVSRGARDIWVSNRTLDRAVELASPLDAAVLPWNRRVEFLTTADIVLCSTGARSPILTRADVKSCRRARRGRPLFLIDISVPRNLDPAIATLDSVYLFDIDDLGRAVAEGQAAREGAAGAAEAIVAGEVTTFARVLAQVHVAPLLKALNLRARRDAQDEVARTMSNLATSLDGLDERIQDKIRASLEKMAGTLNKRMLHHPLARIRTLGQSGELDALAEAARLFGVETTLLSVRDLDAGGTTEPRLRTAGDA